MDCGRARANNQTAQKETTMRVKKPIVPMMRLKRDFDFKMLIYYNTPYGLCSFAKVIGVSSTTLVKISRYQPVRVSTARLVAKGLGQQIDFIFEPCSIQQKTWGNRFGYRMKPAVFRKILADKGLSVKEIADKCGMHYGTLYSHLSGKNKSMSFSKAVILADNLNVDIGLLFDFSQY
jgi:DNA-binding Xre family transcriptional regulator